MISTTTTIHDAQYDYYGKRLATCDSEGQVYVEDKVDKKKHSISGENQEQGPAWKVSWAHPRFGGIIAAGFYDKKVIIFSENQSSNHKNSGWTELWRKDNFNGSMNYVQFAPYQFGLLLAAASSSGHVWAIRASERESTFKEISWQAHSSDVNALSWQPSELADSEGLPRLATGGRDQSVIVWSVDTVDGHQCEKLIELKGVHQAPVRDVAWSPIEGKSYEIIASCSQDGEVFLWKLFKSAEDNGYSHFEVIQLEYPFNAPVWRLSWSLTGQYLAVAVAPREEKENSNAFTTPVVFTENEKGEWKVVESSDK